VDGYVVCLVIDCTVILFCPLRGSTMNKAMIAAVRYRSHYKKNSYPG
jgi:hypothetical protein